MVPLNGLCLLLAVLVTVCDAGRKSARVPLVTFDDSVDSADDDTLFYSSDLGALPEDRPEPEPSVLDTLLLEISQANRTSAEKCQQYKAQIGDICMARFVQRTRFRLDEFSTDVTRQNESTTGTNQQRPTTMIAPAQQICCEFRSTYLRCLLSSINFACPLTEFNSLYTQVQGLSEFCSRFYGKSMKKCRKRFRNRSPQPAPISTDTSTKSPTRR